MSKLLNVLVGVIGGILLLLWGELMFAPQRVAPYLFLIPNGTEGLAAIRAEVGASIFASGLFCLLGIAGRNFQWLVAAASIILAAALGRLIGLAVEGLTEASLIVVVVELVLAAIVLIVARKFYYL